MTRPIKKWVPMAEAMADPEVARIEQLVANVVADFSHKHEIDKLGGPSTGLNPDGSFRLADDLADLLVRELRRDGAIPIPFPSGTRFPDK